ncbi:MAG TPA: RluA family pseudouridine synthase [Burkholderiaceae bacterium]|nr:RluA family pseudouridine synthase [Burkholderiaceae bacterium]
MGPRPSTVELKAPLTLEPDTDDFEPLSGDVLPVRRFLVRADSDGLRLDKYLAGQLPNVSRTRIQKWIEEGAVHLNGVVVRARARVCGDDQIDVTPSEAPQALAFEPEPIAIPVVWEDEAILVIDKPPGLVVHPGAGNWSGTLLNGLLAYDPRLAAVPRAGIVHRLDAGTSGLMVVARTVAAQIDLIRQLQARTVTREYWALVAGPVAPRVTIDAALARDPRNPVRFRVSRALSAKPARTHVRCLAQWRVADSAAIISWVACRLDTGRTHQIRVHLESIGHPLIGDPLYRKHLPSALLAQKWLSRQALHACRLQLLHPVDREEMAWSSAPPEDMRTLMRLLGATDEQLLPPLQSCFESGARSPTVGALGSVRRRTRHAGDR